MMHQPKKYSISRRTALATIVGAMTSPLWAQSSAVWSGIESRARGQTVYFNAWAGSERINAYLQWAGAEMQRVFGVKLEHVKISDTAEVVKRVRAEKAAGKTDGTAKGGVLAAIAQWGADRAGGPVPVYFIGVGEKLEDLETFSAREFALALMT